MLDSSEPRCTDMDNQALVMPEVNGTRYGLELGENHAAHTYVREGRYNVQTFTVT